MTKCTYEYSTTWKKLNKKVSGFFGGKIFCYKSPIYLCDQGPKRLETENFLRDLVRELIAPHVRRRLASSAIQYAIKDKAQSLDLPPDISGDPLGRILLDHLRNPLSGGTVNASKQACVQNPFRTRCRTRPRALPCPPAISGYSL